MVNKEEEDAQPRGSREEKKPSLLQQSFPALLSPKEIAGHKKPVQLAGKLGRNQDLK